MEVQAHTTPESRQALRKYLRDRRMTTSIHQTITMQTLNDLEEALRLLQGVHHPSESWVGEIEAYLEQRTARRLATQGTPLPGIAKEAGKSERDNSMNGIVTKIPGVPTSVL